MDIELIREENFEENFNVPGSFKRIQIYRIGAYEIVIKKYDEYRTVEVRIADRTVVEFGKYLPPIYFEISDVDGDFNPKVEIQTTTYGALNVKEFKLFIDAMDYALQVANKVAGLFTK